MQKRTPICKMCERCFLHGRVRGRLPTGVSAHVDGVIGVARVGTRVGTLGPALLPVHHQLHLVAKLLSDHGVPAAVAEALPDGRVRRCDPPGSVVHVEQQLLGERQLQRISARAHLDTAKGFCCFLNRHPAPFTAGSRSLNIMGWHVPCRRRSLSPVHLWLGY